MTEVFITRKNNRSQMETHKKQHPTRAPAADTCILHHERAIEKL